MLQYNARIEFYRIVVSVYSAQASMKLYLVWFLYASFSGRWVVRKDKGIWSLIWTRRKRFEDQFAGLN